MYTECWEDFSCNLLYSLKVMLILWSLSLDNNGLIVRQRATLLMCRNCCQTGSREGPRQAISCTTGHQEMVQSCLCLILTSLCLMLLEKLCHGTRSGLRRYLDRELFVYRLSICNTVHWIQMWCPAAQYHQKHQKNAAYTTGCRILMLYQRGLVSLENCPYTGRMNPCS